VKIVTPPLIVEDSDAFKNDVLDRKSYGEALLNLVQRSSDELVISLDGRWGEGKTTFVKMWQGLLSESNIPNIYIDAFANDFLDDAFISIAGAITTFVEENIEKESSEQIAELKTKAKKIGGQLLTWSAKVSIKAATLGAIKDSDLEELKDIKGDIAKGTSNFIGNIIEERLTSHSKDLALIGEFKKLLSELPSKLKGKEGNPIIIIIDELDRCKPSFAIEMLEKIKHLFSVKNVVFVLVMHKEQLEESVKCIYGQNIDAHTYLQKFINIETKLPKRITDRYTNDLRSYSRQLIQLHEIETWGKDKDIADEIEPLANHFDLSLRQLEKIYTNLALFYGTSAENAFRIVPIIVFLAVIKTVKPLVFDKLLQKSITYDEVCRETGLSHKNEEHRKLSLLMDSVHFALIPEKEFAELDDLDPIKIYGNGLRIRKSERNNLIPIFSQKLSMFVVE
jgi:hypothetical protein